MRGHGKHHFERYKRERILDTPDDHELIKLVKEREKQSLIDVDRDKVIKQQFAKKLKIL